MTLGVAQVDITAVLLFLVNLSVIVGFCWHGISVLITVRDELRDLKHAVGTRNPPEGLLGDAEVLKRDAIRQRQWLIEINANLPDDRRVRMERT